MISTDPIASDHAQQLVTDWIARMKAPPPDENSQPDRDADDLPVEEFTALAGEVPTADPDPLAGATDPADLDDVDLAALTGSWWRRGAVLATVLGVGIGFAVFGSLGVTNPAAAEIEPEVASTASGLGPAAQQAIAPPALAPEIQAAPDERPADEAVEAGSQRTQATTTTQPRGHRRALASLRPTDERPRALAVQYRRLLRRGWRAYDRGNFQAATNAFARAVHSWPDKTGGYFGMALSLFEQGAEDGAMQVLERGVKKVGPKAGLWVLAGSIYQFKGKARLAKMAYQRYLRNNPRGRYARDVRVILSYDRLPRLHPFEADDEEANPSTQQ